jgi:sugar phosphate isomerase/epimerase
MAISHIGIQLFSLPKLLEQDPRQAFRMLADMGYREVELYGPYTFSVQSAKEAWLALAPRLGFSGSGYFGMAENELKELLGELQLSVPSMHTDYETLLHEMPALGTAARALGAKYVTLPAIPDERRQNLDGYKQVAADFNAIGEAARQEGLKFAYHNHGYGLTEMEGTIPFQLILDQTDPELVFLEMDIYWTTAGRADPIDLLRNNPGRYHLMHLKDMKPKTHFPGDGGDAGQWMELFPYMASAGDGELHIAGIVQEARQSGVKHFFVEQDMVAEPEVALKRSIDYLQKL